MAAAAVVAALAVSAAQGAAPARAPRGVQSDEAEQLFDRGLSHYEHSEYDRARSAFQRLSEFPVNQRTTAGLLMLGKSLFRQGEYGAALEVARSLVRRFPDSRYVPDTRLLAGDCFFLLRRYEDAATQYGRILATVAPLALQSQAAERLAAIAQNQQIDDAALQRLQTDVGTRRLDEALLYGKGRWYARLGRDGPGRAALTRYLDQWPDGVFAALAQRDLGAETVPPPADHISEPPASVAATRRAGVPRLGLLLPLTGTGFQRQVGEDLYAGVQLANEQRGNPFELVVADIGTDYGDLPIAETESSQLLRVVQQARRLIEEEGVVAIIGPVFSSDCIAAAVVAHEAGVPLLAPLAQQSGLDGLGEYVFQLGTVPEVQARALAEYATLVLGLRTLAVIAPLTDYGWSFEREFEQVAYDNGGEVVHSDWYVPEVTKDFRRVFEEIRSVGFRLTPPPTPDTLAAADVLASTLEDTAAKPAEPSFLTELLAGLEGEPAAPAPAPQAAHREAPVDSSEIFIDTIDGIAMVVEHFADAQTLAAQRHFHRLETQVLGNEIWDEPEAIRQMRPGERDDIVGTIFVSSFREEDPASREFIDAFRRRYARDYGYAARGFDAAALCISAWEQGRRTRDELRTWLASVRSYDGASGRISFSADARTNQELALLKIDSRGRIRTLSESDLPALAPPVSDGTGADLDLPREELLPNDLRDGL